MNDILLCRVLAWRHLSPARSAHTAQQTRLECLLQWPIYLQTLLKSQIVSLWAQTETTFQFILNRVELWQVWAESLVFNLVHSLSSSLRPVCGIFSTCETFFSPLTVASLNLMTRGGWAWQWDTIHSKRFRGIFLSGLEMSGCKIHKRKCSFPQSYLPGVNKRSVLPRTVSKQGGLVIEINKSTQTLFSSHIKSVSGEKFLLYVWGSHINVRTGAKMTTSVSRQNNKQSNETWKQLDLLLSSCSARQGQLERFMLILLRECLDPAFIVLEKHFIAHLEKKRKRKKKVHF